MVSSASSLVLPEKKPGQVCRNQLLFSSTNTCLGGRPVPTQLLAPIPLPMNWLESLPVGGHSTRPAYLDGQTFPKFCDRDTICLSVSEKTPFCPSHKFLRPFVRSFLRKESLTAMISREAQCQVFLVDKNGRLVSRSSYNIDGRARPKRLVASASAPDRLAELDTE
jgi:hypothetical protein